MNAENQALQSRAAKLDSVEQITEGFAGHGYISSDRIATAVYLSQHLEKPVLVEGPAGVGKTELAKTAATYLDLPLIRMQLSLIHI